MNSISRACDAEDFEIAARFSRTFGEWDDAEGRARGVPPDLTMNMFHSDDGDSLAIRFSGEDAKLFIARWGGAPAGSVGFEIYDDTTLELQKFYVDPNFRGRGIGKALMQRALSEARTGARTKMLLQTAIYMRDAISVYESFGFVRCPPFRRIPDGMKHTEVFMSRPL